MAASSRFDPVAAAPVAPYRLLAPHYDSILGHFRRAFEALRDRVLDDCFPDGFESSARPSSAARVYADLGCGTGTACLQMAWRGWRAHGIDRSPDMIAAARDKSARIAKAPPALLSWLAGRDHARLRRLTTARARAALNRPLAVDFQVGDLRDFTLPKPADLITCLFDTVNHLPRHADLIPTLRAIRRNLKPGGLALIDANSTRAVREVWPAMKPEVHQDTDTGYCAILQGRPYDSPHKQATLTWTWFLRQPDGHWDRREEHYTEIAWTPAEWRRAIRKAGLKMRWLRDAAALDRGFDPGWRHVLLLAAPGNLQPAR